jgi:hypothetical protein
MKNVIPPNRPDAIDSVVFFSNANNPVTLVNFTARDNASRGKRDAGDCATVSKQSDSQDLEIGAPHAGDEYPQSYWDERKKWFEEIEDNAGSERAWRK